MAREGEKKLDVSIGTGRRRGMSCGGSSLADRDHSSWVVFANTDPRCAELCAARLPLAEERVHFLIGADNGIPAQTMPKPSHLLFFFTWRNETIKSTGSGLVFKLDFWWRLMKCRKKSHLMAGQFALSLKCRSLKACLLFEKNFVHEIIKTYFL